MNKYNSKIMQIIKGFLFSVLVFSLCFICIFALLYNFANIELIGSVFLSIIIAIFGTIISNLFKLLLTEVD